MAVSYDSDVNISRRGTFPLSFKAWGIAWGYLQVNDLGRLRENQATKSMAKRECKLREWKKVLEVHNSVWYWSRYLTTNSWKCLPGLWRLWWSTGSQITHICTDVTTGVSEVFAFMNDITLERAGTKQILHVITVRKIGCQQMWQRKGRDFLYFHLSPVTAYRSSSKSSRITANTNRGLWLTL